MTERSKQSLTLELAPQIEGLRFRNFAGDQDFEHMARIFNTSNAADNVKEASTAKSLAHHYAHKKDADPYQDITFAEVDGEAVAYGHVFWEKEHEGPLVYFLSGFVLPDWRRKGIGTALFRHNEERLRAIAAGHDPEQEKVFHGWAASTEIGRNKLFVDRGYEETRYFYLMLRDLSQPIPEAEMPQGLETRSAEESQYRQIFDASNEAFRDHWMHVEQKDEDYQRWIEGPNFDASLWQVAWEGDKVAGMVLNEVHAEENKELGVNWGWTDPICVLRPWRRRGLATALVIESLHLLKEKGFTHAALGVDTQNPSGALTLYESVGYVIEEHWTDYRRKMD